MAYELIIGEPRDVAKRLNANKDFIPFLTRFIDDADKLLVIGQTRSDVAPVWPLTYDVAYDVDVSKAVDEDGTDWAEGWKNIAHGLYLTRNGAKGLVLLKHEPRPENPESNNPIGEIHISEEGVGTISGFEDWPEPDSKVWIRADGSVNGNDQNYEYFTFDNIADAVENFTYQAAVTTEEDWEGNPVARGQWGVSVSTRGYQAGPSGFGTFPIETEASYPYPREGYYNKDTGEMYSPNGGWGGFDIEAIQGPFRELRTALARLEGDENKMYNVTVLRQNKLQYFVLEIGIPNNEGNDS